MKKDKLVNFLVDEETMKSIDFLKHQRHINLSSFLRESINKKAEQEWLDLREQVAIMQPETADGKEIV